MGDYAHAYLQKSIVERPEEHHTIAVYSQRVAHACCELLCVVCVTTKGRFCGARTFFLDCHWIHNQFPLPHPDAFNRVHAALFFLLHCSLSLLRFDRASCIPCLIAAACDASTYIRTTFYVSHPFFFRPPSQLVLAKSRERRARGKVLVLHSV